MSFIAAITLNGRAVGGTIYSFYDEEMCLDFLATLRDMNVGQVRLIPRPTVVNIDHFSHSSVNQWLIKNGLPIIKEKQNQYFDLELETVPLDQGESPDEDEESFADLYSDQGPDSRFAGGYDLMDIYEQAHDMDTWS